MRFFLCSADPPQIERLAKILSRAGVQCEVRLAHIGVAKDCSVIEAELRLRDKNDYKTASMLLAQLRRRQQEAQMCRRN